MNTENIDTNIILKVAERNELNKFKIDLQDAFSVAVVEQFGHNLDEPIPSDKDIEESFKAPGAVVYHIISNGKIIGGVVLTIDELTQHNSLDLFFISAKEHNRGIGYKAWKAIEKLYPKTEVWETITPYFEKRNIHFYVNKCGFKIVEYYNKYNPDPHHCGNSNFPSGEEMFKFEKIMK